VTIESLSNLVVIHPVPPLPWRSGFLGRTVPSHVGRPGQPDREHLGEEEHGLAYISRWVADPTFGVACWPRRLAAD
jgi:hypothetical protein